MQTKEAMATRYVLITPARNEARYIKETLESVVSQTVRPLRWVIVSDGSTDGTDDIVQAYAFQHAWIELLRMPERQERHFAGKVHAFDAGYARVRHLDYDVIGNLDGDTSFEPDYIEYLLGKFAQNPGLGVAGTNYWENAWEHTLKYDYRFTNIQDVTGQCQLFRRECFEDIGGYKPNKDGGIDLVATLSARMHGWETRIFTDKFLIHHRQQGTANVHSLIVEFHNGRKDYLFGSHWLWEACRAAYTVTRKPFLIGGCLLFVGYFWTMSKGTGKTVASDMIEFRRREQMQRLRGFVRTLLSRTTRGATPSPAAENQGPAACPADAGGRSRLGGGGDLA